MKQRIIIADDHQVVRQGLRNILEQQADLEVVAEASDGIAVEKLVYSMHAELLILDVGLPLRRGIEVVTQLRAAGYLVPVLFFSMYPAEQYIEYAKKAGAQGFIGKHADAGELLAAIYKILAGKSSFVGQVARAEMLAPVNHGLASLSVRERQVLQGLLAGTSLQELAMELRLSSKTLTTYRTRLLKKLNVRSNAELVALVSRHGYV